MYTCLFAANGLLSLRLIALYRRKKLMVWFITGFFLSTYLATLGLLIHSMVLYHDTIHYIPAVKSCAATGHSPTMAAIFYAPAAFESFVFGMTAYSAIKDSRVITGQSAPFLVVLYRDGLVCFVVMIALRIWNCWIYITQPVSCYNMGTPLMWATNAVLTTRIYINLVWVAKRPLLSTAAYPSQGNTFTGRDGVRVAIPPTTTFEFKKGSILDTSHELDTLRIVPELRSDTREEI
ncbi:hypothetical protein FRB91_011973 [Serendipita sp. 411]|nr:hypothetical protein FRC16_009052 [Serendipita sp. 398]KAG8847234.1 hypothetical protein FRB91_011973 [Serendipita sp. 411]KAG8865910.1 hypothetical protein FRC20_009300 [Serendipita sp. 405]KAG9054325.1 hypothetical protein FS842_005455 [Serendipita sp. 407]